MNRLRKIVFHVGGPSFHPTRDQASKIVPWLGSDYVSEVYEGNAAFDSLDDCDLLVLMGMFWTGSTAEWAGQTPYVSPSGHHRAEFETYVSSGRPLLVHHGAVASYDDWPEYGRLLGFRWVWNKSSHSPLGDHLVKVLPTSHPVVSGVGDYRIHDELYYDIEITPGLEPTVHALAQWEGRSCPMVMTAEGGRIDGAGRVVYLANGHDLRALECEAMRRLWVNAAAWLLG